ncbi:hypothetical protein [Corynebacterium glyciniphilum]|uniref:hypothetical protein n=1 Tax=Corynebacterium glyciniphilum TaxID=1404244 RepID=UPI0028CB7BC7|nr:hypothetical protein [Corynebacterium glyciniphilum]
MQAVAFYRRRGFTVIGRDDLDDAGRPYPVLHMSWTGSRGTSVTVPAAQEVFLYRCKGWQ